MGRHMNVSASPSTPGFQALAGGLRGQLQAQNLRSVLDVGGLGGPDFDRVTQAMEAEGKAIAQAGVKLIADGLRGQLIDILA